MDFILTPGAPFFLGAVAAGLLAAMGLLLMSRQYADTMGGWRRPSTGLLSGRYVVGNLIGLPVAAALLLIVVAGGMTGSPRVLLLALAAGVYLYAGLVVPRRPLVQRQKEAVQLRALTPGFISFVRVGMGSFESPMDIMRRYTVRPVEKWAVMQTLITDAVQVSLDQRMRPFASLTLVARERGCRELLDVAEALAQAETEGGRIDTVLEAQQATLELILQSEFKRMIRRRTMYLLLMVAVALVIGILGNLLFTMVWPAISGLA